MSSQRLTDLMQSPACENDIQFYFITKSGTIDDASEDLKYSFQVKKIIILLNRHINWHISYTHPKSDNSGLIGSHRKSAMDFRSWLSAFRCFKINKKKCFRSGRVCGWSFRSFVGHQGYVSFVILIFSEIVFIKSTCHWSMYNRLWGDKT